MNDHFGTLCEVLVAETRKLLEAQGYHVTSRAPVLPSPGELVVGTIGFSGGLARGALTLAAHADVWRHLVPRALGDVSLTDDCLCDMVGETCNMALGRFRNALLRHGVTVGCAIPSSFRGSHMDLPAPVGRRSVWRTFDTEHGPMCLRFDATLKEGFALAPEHEIQPVEDELVLF